MKHSFNRAMSTVGYLIFRCEKLNSVDQSFNIRYQNIWQTWSLHLFNNKTSLFRFFCSCTLELFLISQVYIILLFFFLSSDLLLACGGRTTRFGGLLLSWRCRIRAPTCWLRTAKERWRTGSTRSTKSCTAALRSPCRRRGTETFMTVRILSAPEGTQIWNGILFALVKILSSLWWEVI